MPVKSMVAEVGQFLSLAWVYLLRYPTLNLTLWGDWVNTTLRCRLVCQFSKKFLAGLFLSRLPVSNSQIWFCLLFPHPHLLLRLPSFSLGGWIHRQLCYLSMQTLLLEFFSADNSIDKKRF